MRTQIVLFSIMINLFLSLHVYAQKQNEDIIQLKTMVEKYCQSINNNDTTLASSIWEHSNEVAFIHPRGHEIGWENIKKNIYHFFWDYFTHRKLTSLKEDYSFYGNTANVDFYWDYQAVFKMNNEPIHTKGRESQVWLKENNTWKLVHIHYSNMPVSEAREGF